MDVQQLVEGVLAGDRRAVARAISMVEDGADGLAELSAGLYPHTGSAYTIGLTGSPGVGKSSLAAQLVQAVRSRELSIAVLAIDPTSPFTGGALLGRSRPPGSWKQSFAAGCPRIVHPPSCTRR